MVVFLIFLFIITYLVGFCTLWFKEIKPQYLHLILAFSGAFLLSISFLHLLPESYHDVGDSVGIYILLGFFLQLSIQKLSHGIEHGHVHHLPNQTVNITFIFLGLGIHSFMEGVPLGFNYHSSSTMPSVLVGIAAHKIPEMITIGLLLIASPHIRNKKSIVFLFALLSPLAGILTLYFGQHYYSIAHIITYIIPVVVGAFLHIATTILFESGTKHHQLSSAKILVILAGVALGFCTLFF